VGGIFGDLGGPYVGLFVGETGGWTGGGGFQDLGGGGFGHLCGGALDVLESLFLVFERTFLPCALGMVDFQAWVGDFFRWLDFSNPGIFFVLVLPIPSPSIDPFLLLLIKLHPISFRLGCNAFLLGKLLPLG